MRLLASTCPFPTGHVTDTELRSFHRNSIKQTSAGPGQPALTAHTHGCDAPEELKIMELLTLEKLSETIEPNRSQMWILIRISWHDYHRGAEPTSLTFRG